MQQVASYLLFGQVLLPHYIHIGSDLQLGVRRFAPCAKEHQQKHSAVISQNANRRKRKHKLIRSNYHFSFFRVLPKITLNYDC